MKKKTVKKASLLDVLVTSTKRASAKTFAYRAACRYGHMLMNAGTFDENWRDKIITSIDRGLAVFQYEPYDWLQEKSTSTDIEEDLYKLKNEGKIDLIEINDKNKKGFLIILKFDVPTFTRGKGKTVAPTLLT